MNTNLSAVIGAMRVESKQLIRSPLLIILTVVQAITFLFLVSIFGLTGAMAPTALIDEDRSPVAQMFVDSLNAAHHSFRLEVMTHEQAIEMLSQGRLVAEIVIPPKFSETIVRNQVSPLLVTVDNIDADMTADIQRALPSAITKFAKALDLPEVHVTVDERDLIDHDTGFIPYLVVSALALDAFVVAGILSAVSVAREFETGTVKLLQLAPIHPLAPFIGRMLAADVVALVAMLISEGIVIVLYGVVPVYPIEMLAALVLCVLIFGCVGAALGVAMKRTLPVASLIFGLALPLYIDSGSLEPERFDGNVIWTIAHLSPIYYAVGVLEHAAHGFQVTPEPIIVDVLILFAWAIGMLWIAGYIVQRRLRS
jgi:ABC-2 type transport system permease protein